MLLRFALVVPLVGQIRPEVRAPLQAGAGHAQPHEDGVGQLLDVEFHSIAVDNAKKTSIPRLRPAPESSTLNGCGSTR